MHGNQMEENALGALTGAGLAALVWWDRLDRRTQNRLLEAREDARDALGKIQSLVTSADFVRLFLPIVRDMIVGTALGSTQITNPQPVPSLPTPPTRPNISQENAAASYVWPPKPGLYDGNGNVETVGELTTAFVALTYPEVRAALLALSQKDPLSQDALRQVFRAFNQLVAVVSGLNLSAAQYAAAWERLFAVLTGQALTDPHQDPTKAPSALILDPSVASIQPLTAPMVPFNQANTDAGFRFRVIPVAGGCPANTVFARIMFGTPYRALDAGGNVQPMQPIVTLSQNLPIINVVNVTAVSFDLQAYQQISGGTPRDIFGCTTAGQGTV